MAQGAFGEVKERNPLEGISIAELQLMKLKGNEEPTLIVRYGLDRHTIDVAQYAFGDYAPRPAHATHTISSRPLIIIDTEGKGPFAIDLGNRRLFHGEASHKNAFIRSTELKPETLMNLHLDVDEPFDISQVEEDDRENPFYIIGRPKIRELILTSSLMSAHEERKLISGPDLEIASTVAHHRTPENMRDLPINRTSLTFFRLMNHVGKSPNPEHRTRESADNLHAFNVMFEEAKAAWIATHAGN